MAVIAIEGPNAAEMVKQLEKVLGAESVVGWDLSPTVPNVVRLNLLRTLTPAEAIQFIDRAAYENKWISHEGWFARHLVPDEQDGQVEGILL